jgi:hypothetical protein
MRGADRSLVFVFLSFTVAKTLALKHHQDMLSIVKVNPPYRKNSTQTSNYSTNQNMMEDMKIHFPVVLG